MYILVKSIIVNKQGISEEHVDEFVELYGRGWKAKPITVRRLVEDDECPNGYCGVHSVPSDGWSCRVCLKFTKFVLVDGRHRLAAHKILGKEMILAYVTL